MKHFPGKGTSLGNALEVLKLPFITGVLEDSDVWFIKGKQTFLDILGASSFLSSQTQGDKGYVAKKNGLIFYTYKMALFVCIKCLF